jgi:hypothetical protein
VSVIAPWLALAVDWDESEMWDSLPQYGIEESTMGERLAWVCLICEAKKKGRGGKVSIRKSVFQKAHRLTGRAVDGMLIRAQKCGAIEVDGDFVTLYNWRSYQHKTAGVKQSDSPEIPDTPQNGPTKDTSPRTHHTSPTTSGTGRTFVKPTLVEVQAYCTERGKGVDAQKWFDHYESNGWKVGRNPMRDWKAAVRKWEGNDYGFSGKQTRHNVGPGQRYSG